MLTFWLGMAKDHLFGDLTFSALANAERRRMLDLLILHPGMHIAALASHFGMSEVAVLKHVRILERSRLVHSERVGRERRLWFNPMPIQEIYDRWTTQYSAHWAGRVADIKSRVEARMAQKAVKRA